MPMIQVGQETRDRLDVIGYAMKSSGKMWRDEILNVLMDTWEMVGMGG